MKSSRPRVAYLVVDPNRLTPEESAGWEFLSSRRGIAASRITFENIRRRPATLQGVDILWWHFDGSTEIPEAALDPFLRLTLKHFVRNGSSILLSLLAAQYVTDLEFEPKRPSFIEKGPWRQESWAKDYPDIRGFASFQGHPLFAGFAGGVYTWNPTVGTEYSAAVYSGTVPENGSVAAVERLYIKINDDWRIINEYRIGKGLALTIGTFFFFRDARQRFRKQLESFTLNCFAYLGKKGERRSNRNAGLSVPPTTYWNFETREVRRTTHTTKRGRRRRSIPWNLPPPNLILRRDFAELENEQYFDLGGRRILFMGTERGGLREIWCHPVRILNDVRIAFKAGDGELVWSDSLAPQVLITPECVVRTYHIGDAVVEEVLFTDRSLPAGAIHYRAESRASVEVVVTAKVDLRLMWPLNERATGSLLHAWDTNLHACVVRNGSGDLYSVVGADREPEEFVVGQFSAVQVLPTGLVGTNTKDVIVGMGFRLSLKPRSPQATVIFSGSGTGEADAVRAFEAIAKNPAQVLARQSNHFRSLLEDSTVITGPDDSFNAGFRWALAAMDRFVVETPHLGTAFAAGFGFSTSGWDGDQKVSGRPGYAWYFGRDSAWTSLAALESGNAESVRSTLELLGRYQDVTGKILHELTTSGFAHYDSADATPLYVHLMGRYLAATGDLSFIRKEFPRLLKAMQFCSSTDTDGDLLIENTNVGHGWVEGGKLFPVHTEHYLASCWYAALHSAASVAAAVGKKTLASEWSGKAKLVRETILNTFWNPAREFYNFGKYADGTFNTEKTILPAVGMYLGIADQDKADACLSEYASANFTADWGTRIIGRDNLFFNPQGYHSGSVWPLFSGWNSLAEFQWNRPMQGYLHLMNNLLLYNQFAAGFIQEVLHGDVFQPAGVCPHQAWSESMVVQPTLEGMLGLLVDVPAHRITLRPYFPPSWNSAEVQNIIVGTTRVRVQMKRTGDTTRYTFKAERKERKHSKPEALRVTLQPAFPLGTRVKSVSIGSRRKKIERVIRRPYDVPPIEFDFIRDVEVSIQHSAGIALVPPVSSPTVGQSSKGPRIIAEEWKNGTYRLTVEVRPDTEYTFDLRDPDRMIRVVEGATLERRRNEYLEIRVAPDPQAAISGAYVRREIVVVT